ncbi:hypothetical protein QLQ12_00945 [Actinoplanes sp. NEAU-A12]|uniref:CYTH domain-containing protein n=1 Tax=Actinoplanes sandaracinus TaxID=3045177 RepID=A0ABT6WBR0_9ACTN|nr:hypothetical protein [Actinoplanes sandaracinus]MDI6097175.1 hypothetical protein [Actinoplanes sandaracinus]
MNSHEPDFGERLRGMTVTGASPDGQIRATISGELSLQIRFQPRTYEWYDERGLARQLAGLGTSTWVAWERERREIYRLSQSLSRDEADQERRARGDSRHERYAEGLRALECRSVSPSEVVHIRTVGIIEWHVDIEAGTLRRLREQEFLGELRAAFAGLMRDRERELILLKAEHFDLGIPRSWVDRVR